MNKRNLGSTFSVSEVGLGCWQFGGDFGAIKEETVFDILNAAVKNGISFFDTADVYGDGISESLIGKFLKTCEKKITIATKFGRSSDVYPNNYTKEKLKEHVLSSTKRLGVKQLDLLQLHCIPLDVLKQGDIFNYLRELKKEGLIKEFGASVENIEEGLICLKQKQLASLQIIFNIFRQKPLEELLIKAKEKNIGIIVRLPLASGLLSGKFNENTRFEKQDHRNFNKDGAFFNVGETFSGLEFSQGLKLVEKIKTEVPSTMTMSQFALRWILDHDAVSVIIPGASSKEQVLSNTLSSSFDSLGINIHNKLSTLYVKEIQNKIRGTY